jgi:serine O-acetyltransferase
MGRSTDRPLLERMQRRHPRFKDAVLADFRLQRRALGDRRYDPKSKIHTVVDLALLFFGHPPFAALVLCRFKASCQRRRIPVLPRLADQMARVWAQVCIGDTVVMHPGVRLTHGNVVIDGYVEVHSDVVIRPFVTIGQRGHRLRGPTVHRGVYIGTGAKVLGTISLGDGAKIGANSVVIHDVAPGAVVVGAPARRIR